MGANDPCWCGSGKKYKRCHRDRGQEKPIHPKELSNQYRRPFERKFCLHPDANKITCGKKIISAHTLQRAGAIRQLIDASNHVLTFYPPERESNGELKLHSRGWRDASTFTGFCDTHDNELFADIENRLFASDEKQCLLIGY